MAYIISGIRKTPRVLIGRAGIKIPFLERVDKLIVRQVSIDIKSEGYIPTNDFNAIKVNGKTSGFEPGDEREHIVLP